MGYRSDVYLKTTKEGYKKIREMVRKDEDAFHLFTHPDRMTITQNSDGEYISMEWQYLKWYSEYDEVKAIDNAIDELSDTVPIHFIRLGEDIEDIEERFYYPNDYKGYFEGLDIVRTVYIDGKDISDKEVL